MNARGQAIRVVQLLPALNEGGIERGVMELNREYVARGSAHDIARRSVSAHALWVARGVARQREPRPMHRNLLIVKGFPAMHPQYNIVLM